MRSTGQYENVNDQQIMTINKYTTTALVYNQLTRPHLK